MAHYPQIESQIWYDVIVIVTDRCSGQNPVEATRQSNPQKYYYTGEEPALNWELNPFLVEESNC